jgi:hypothetical protein
MYCHMSPPKSIREQFAVAASQITAEAMQGQRVQFVWRSCVNVGRFVTSQREQESISLVMHGAWNFAAV